MVDKCKQCGKTIKKNDAKFGRANSYLKYNFKCRECHENETTDGIKLKVDRSHYHFTRKLT